LQSKSRHGVDQCDPRGRRPPDAGSPHWCGHRDHKAPSDRPVATGIITDRDITCAQLDRAADLGSLSAEEVMTRNPLEINEEDSLSQAIETLRVRGVRRAPVVSSNGALVGLVSTDDLLACVARELMHLGRLVALQSGQEEKRKSSH
jgi:signal-transduction protein with cAMP-binding, CBS, and nucleotidyltransferase domain